MNNHWSLCAFADEADPNLKGQVEALSDNGINLLEIRGVDGKSIARTSIDKVKAIKTYLDDNNIAVWSIGSPTGKINLKDDFEEHLDNFMYLLEAANILGASRYRLFSFYGYDGSTAARDEVMVRLQTFVDKAKGSNIVLCHENEKDIYGEGALACRDIHINIPEIKAVFDPANFIHAKEDTLTAWELLAPYVDYMHIKDADSDGKVVPAGYGVGNLKLLIEKFKNIGGQVLSIEPHLANFVGLKDLESKNSSPRDFSFSSTREAFDTAIKATRALLD